MAIEEEGLHSPSQRLDLIACRATNVGPDRRRLIFSSAKAAEHEDDKTAIKAGNSAQKDTNARWTMKDGGKVRYRPDGTALPMIAIPTFGYKSHIVIDRRYGLIRKSAATSAAHSDGRMLPKIVTTDNTSSNVWADSIYRSKANEAWLSSKVLRSQIHRRKPKGRPMSVATSRANDKKSSIRARVEHVFAHQKKRYRLFSRTIGLVRKEAKLTLANIAYNMDQLVFH